MLSLIVDKALKDSKTKDNIIRLSFFAFHGFIGAILLSDILRLLFGEFPYKHQIGYVLAAGVLGTPFLDKRFVLMQKTSNNIAMGLGLFIGTLVSNGSDIGIVS